MTAQIEPIQTAAGIAYRVTRVFRVWQAAQIGAVVLDEISEVDLEAPAEPLAAMPPNCDGLPVIDGRAMCAILALHEERDEP